MHYLSIDVDYWYNRAKGATIAAAYLDQVACLCYARLIPIHAVMNHRQMLPLIDSSGADTLINLDMHSDLADTTVSDLNCGTFVAYVKWRRTGHYHWIQGDPISRGECNGGEPIFCSNGRYRMDLTDWGSIQRTFTRKAPIPTSLIRVGECAGVGVCLSPGYCGYELEQVFHEWRKKWNVPYRKGRRHEYGPGVERSPR